jgi:nucleotide-binding universal stress UspA family protein
MGMKTILVPTENHESMRSTLSTALVLARRFDSYIEGFPLRWAVSEFLAADAMGGIPLETYRQDVVQEAKEARGIFEAFMQDNQVPRATGASGSLSFGWLDDAPEGDGFVGSYGRVFDVIVTGRPDPNLGRLHNRAIEAGLFDSGRPVLLAPPSPPRQIATNVLIAWNSSPEQARATALAMPLLKQAERVVVLSVVGGAAVAGPPAEQLVRYLQRSGITPQSLSVELNGKSSGDATGEAILKAAAKEGCDLLIKGAYTQSRLRQMIFGGATRHILENAPLPVLLAH